MDGEMGDLTPDPPRFRGRSQQPAKRDADLPRRHPDWRAHNHAGGVDSHNKCSAPPGWEPTMAVFVYACRTPGCRVEGLGGTVNAILNADGIVRIMCGACNEWVEDYVEQP